jgi:hypothetical protein
MRGKYLDAMEDRMRRDVIANVFLFFTTLSLLLVFRYPVYFSYGQVIYRAVSIPERIFSVVFILLWITLCVYAAYFKRIYLLIGGILYGLMPYMPGLLIPMLSESQASGKPNLAATLTVSLLKRIYELENAPFVGVSVLFPPEKAIDFSKLLLPVLLISYVGTQLFRFYRNAYLAEKLRLDDTSYAGRTAPAKAATAAVAESPEKLQDSVRPAPDLLMDPSPEPRRIAEGELLPEPVDGEPILLSPPQVPDEPILLFPPTGAVPAADIIFEKPDPALPSDSGEAIDLDRTVIHLPPKQPRKKRSEKPREDSAAETDL